MSKLNVNNVYKLIYPVFQPGFCQGVVEIVKDNNVIVIFVDTELSKNKIEAIIESDFAPEQQLLKVEVDKI